MICLGRNTATGQQVQVKFGETIESIESIDAMEAGVASDIYVAPGFIDLQVNGFAGVDFNDPAIPVEDVARATDAILATGVTRFFPTVITAPAKTMLSSLGNLHRARKQLVHAAAVAGFHVEGPHIDPTDGPRGAHPVGSVRAPDFDEFQRWQEVTDGSIRIVTLSPHWPEAVDYIERLCAAGVVVAIGHTGASSAQIAEAVSAGATLSTHLGNAGPAMVRKFPNCLWDQLAEDRLSASFILDGAHLGAHLDPAYLRVALRAKGLARTILVTDAATPAGAMPGDYRLGELDVELTRDGRVVLRGQERLAGSALRMNRAIANLMATGEATLAEAVAAATVNPANVARISGRMHGLATGERADVVVFRLTDRLEILEVYLDGKRTGVATA